MSYRVIVSQTGQSFQVNAGESVLGAALRQDVPLAHECTFGGCGTCRVKLLEGSVAYEDFPMALTPEEAQQGYALVCQARAQSDLVISAAPAAPAASEPQRRIAVVQDLRRLSLDVTQLQLTLPEGEAFDYLAGQHMNVHLDDGTHRSFSMACAPGADRFEFHVRRIPGGRFTEDHMSRLAPGALLDVELPLGNFRLHAEDYQPIVMVATGTGLAPLKGMLETLFDDDDCPPVWLYWGARSPVDLYLDAQIRTWAQRLYEFQYVPVLSRAGDDWPGRRGHVQQAVLQDIPDLAGHSIYLCGSPTMIHDAKQSFLARGADLDHIYSDGFSFQHAFN
jgi:CDP-4-dehydro-6-deoxyglucose reductase, E3